jgi:hypothetical protein
MVGLLMHADRLAEIPAVVERIADRLLRQALEAAGCGLSSRRLRFAEREVHPYGRWLSSYPKGWLSANCRGSGSSFWLDITEP